MHKNSIETHAIRCTINDEYCNNLKRMALYAAFMQTKNIKDFLTPSALASNKLKLNQKKLYNFYSCLQCTVNGPFLCQSTYAICPSSVVFVGFVFMSGFAAAGIKTSTATWQ